MDMTGQYRIPAPRERVWAALNDPEILRASIPGCETLERVGPDEMTARVVAKIGPVKATFNGRVRLEDMVPPESYRIAGEGQGGVAGFAKGGADVHLAEDGDGTLLTYTAKAQIGGKLAQLGARLVDSTAKMMADQFFSRFSALAGAEAPAAAAPLPVGPGPDVAGELAAAPPPLPEAGTILDRPVVALEPSPADDITAAPMAAAAEPDPLTRPIPGGPADQGGTGPRLAPEPVDAVRPPGTVRPAQGPVGGLPPPRREVPRWVWLAGLAVLVIVALGLMR
ncbi:SRPBCC family protein [Prosthecomicrobium sp. N25]|uniref:SRPBCC family protein n=1 Tax=Prosthecomicrobium sp. N25 TaxID=3129254 RepID=UPI00307707A4